MWRLSGCPKCCGSLEQNGLDWVCLNCGYIKYGIQPLPLVGNWKTGALNRILCPDCGEERWLHTHDETPRRCLECAQIARHVGKKTRFTVSR